MRGLCNAFYSQLSGAPRRSCDGSSRGNGIATALQAAHNGWIAISIHRDRLHGSDDAVVQILVVLNADRIAARRSVQCEGRIQGIVRAATTFRLNPSYDGNLVVGCALGAEITQERVSCKRCGNVNDMDISSFKVPDGETQAATAFNAQDL
jgi:hypothetical protein